MRTLFFLLLAGAAAAMLVIASVAPDREPPVPEPPLVYAPAPQALVEEPAAGEVVREFAVANMCCKQCTGKLYASLTAVTGVRSAAVSFEERHARVICAPELPVDDLLAALNVDKYQATFQP